MKLTPLDLRKQQFARKLRGYDPDEVRAFIETVARQWEEVLDEHRHAEGRVREIEGKLKHYEQVELALQEAIQTARESARRAEALTEQRTKLIVEEAELRALRIVEDARQERYGLKQDVVKLTHRQQEVAARMRAFLTAELEVLAQLTGDDPAGFLRLAPASERPPATLAPPASDAEALADEGVRPPEETFAAGPAAEASDTEEPSAEEVAAALDAWAAEQGIPDAPPDDAPAAAPPPDYDEPAAEMDWRSGSEEAVPEAEAAAPRELEVEPFAAAATDVQPEPAGEWTSELPPEPRETPDAAPFLDLAFEAEPEDEAAAPPAPEPALFVEEPEPEGAGTAEPHLSEEPVAQEHHGFTPVVPRALSAPLSPVTPTVVGEAMTPVAPQVHSAAMAPVVPITSGAPMVPVVPVGERSDATAPDGGERANPFASPLYNAPFSGETPPAASEPPPASDAAQGWSLRSLVTGEAEPAGPPVAASEAEREKIRRLLEDLD